MFKKIFFIGVLTLSILFFSTVILAKQYYDQYPGVGFFPRLQGIKYYKEVGEVYLYHNDSSDEYYFCPVTFNVSDGSTYFIKSIGMRFKDNLVNGYITVHLIRENLYTGACHVVAFWNSGQSEASSSVKTASKGTELGVKLVDTKKFTYWLEVWFYVFGDVNPNDDLILHQVRIHYGT